MHENVLLYQVKTIYLMFVKFLALLCWMINMDVHIKKPSISHEESNCSLIPDFAFQFFINQVADNWLISIVIREKHPTHSICRISNIKSDLCVDSVRRMMNRFKTECDALTQASGRKASVTEERLHREEHWTRTRAGSQTTWFNWCTGKVSPTKVHLHV